MKNQRRHDDGCLVKWHRSPLCYLDARFDRDFSEQSGFLKVVFLHHLVHAITVESRHFIFVTNNHTTIGNV